MNTILNILLFAVSLCFLICLHELGHFLVAKRFKVYCYEFSIGMGPLVYKHKKPNKETQFSIRALPVGGYVAMAGDEDEGDRTNKEVAAVPKERTIAGIKWYKQVAIFSAGIIVNFILGYLFFFVSFVLCPQPNFDDNVIKIMKGSSLITESNALKAGDLVEVFFIEQVMTIKGEEFVITNPESSLSKIPVSDYIEISNTLDLSFLSGEEKKKYTPMSENDTRSLKFYTNDGQTDFIVSKTNALKVENKDNSVSYTWDKIGFTVESKHLGFTKGVGKATKQFGDGTVVIFKAIGQLFTGKGFNEMGGIISMFALSEQSVSMGAATFFNLWGLISVNLAIFNLIPIPGLDGWQMIVGTVEGVSKKKIPNKFKNIVSYIGLGLMFVLMFALLIKDIISFF